MPPTKFWAEMSWRDFAAMDMTKAVAILPVAAIEQHGPHLPVATDAFIGEGYLKRAIARVPDDWPALFLPPQTIGASDEHSGYPGTLTLPFETLVGEIGLAFRRVHREKSRVGPRDPRKDGRL